MHNVLILGAGKIGSLISCLLVQSGAYEVHVADYNEKHLGQVRKDLEHPRLHTALADATDREQLLRLFRTTRADAVVSALPYYCNAAVAAVALDCGTHYFDLTEDVDVSHRIRNLSAGADRAFVPQCGLAPGFISIVANELMTHFETLDTVKLRVGALPVNPNNVLKYSLTWSTNGLINEYGNMCYGIENGVEVPLMPLEGYETISVDGLLYEAFNTSGGVGTLAQTYNGRVRTLNYKTLRYPGHCEKIQFLMQDLKLNSDRATLTRILENAVPKTLQDVVLIYVSVNGCQRGTLFEENYVKKVYPQRIAGVLWSAIQVTTASGVCAVLDLILDEPSAHNGFVTQESFALSDFLENRFGQYYK